jgi:hypothetical protein
VFTINMRNLSIVIFSLFIFSLNAQSQITVNENGTVVQVPVAVLDGSGHLPVSLFPPAVPGGDLTGTLDNLQIAANAVTAVEISNGEITTSKFNPGTLTNQYFVWNGTAWTLAQQEYTVSTSGSQAVSVVTATAMTNGSFSVTAGKKYEVMARLVYNAAATTTGIALSYTAPAGAVWSEYKIPGAATTTQGTSRYNSSTLWVSTSSVATTNNLAIANFRIEPATSGTFQINFASEVAASAITMIIGSKITIKELF